MRYQGHTGKGCINLKFGDFQSFIGVPSTDYRYGDEHMPVGTGPGV